MNDEKEILEVSDASYDEAANQTTITKTVLTTKIKSQQAGAIVYAADGVTPVKGKMSIEDVIAYGKTLVEPGHDIEVVYGETASIVK